MSLENNVLGQFPYTKEEINIFADSIVMDVIEGNISSLEIARQLSAIETFIKRIKANNRFNSSLIDEAGAWQENTFNTAGAKFTKRETGVKYDFSNCNDFRLERFENAEKSIKDKIKSRKDMLKGLPYEGLADPETGELMFPPSKESKSTVVVTLK